MSDVRGAVIVVHDARDAFEVPAASDLSMYKIESPEDGGKAPNGPNFLLIVILFGVSILVVLGLAYLFIPSAAGYMRNIVHPDRHSTSELRVAPGSCEIA